MKNHNLKFKASLDAEELRAIAKDAKRLGVTVEQLCGAIVAREAENMVNGQQRAFIPAEVIGLYTRGLKD